jgi:hypothetical protein
MPATTTADRLTFTWQPTWDANAPVAVEVTESRPRSTKRTKYVVGEDRQVSGGRVWHVAKHPDETGERADEVYETACVHGVWYCTCKGSACRKHAISCRHQLAIQYLQSEGVM